MTPRGRGAGRGMRLETAGCGWEQKMKDLWEHARPQPLRMRPRRLPHRLQQAAAARAAIGRHQRDATPWGVAWARGGGGRDITGGIFWSCRRSEAFACLFGCIFPRIMPRSLQGAARRRRRLPVSCCSSAHTPARTAPPLRLKRYGESVSLKAGVW